MSNLGKYQDIVVAAKEAGGVDPFLRGLERAAFLRGAGVALGATSAVLLVASVLTRRQALRMREASDHPPVEFRIQPVPSLSDAYWWQHGSPRCPEHGDDDCGCSR